MTIGEIGRKTEEREGDGYYAAKDSGWNQTQVAVVRTLTFIHGTHSLCPSKWAPGTPCKLAFLTCGVIISSLTAVESCSCNFCIWELWPVAFWDRKDIYIYIIFFVQLLEVLRPLLVYSAEISQWECRLTDTMADGKYHAVNWDTHTTSTQHHLQCLCLRRMRPGTVLSVSFPGFGSAHSPTHNCCSYCTCIKQKRTEGAIIRPVCVDCWID